MAKSRTRKKEAAVASEPVAAPVTPVPDVFDEQIEARKREADQAQAAALVQQITDTTRFPVDAERAAAHENGHAASVGRREPVITTSGLTGRAVDLLAGVKRAEGFRLVGGRKVQETVISFEEKPSAEVIAKMVDAGFSYKPVDKLWTHPVRPDSALQDRLHGERVFDDVAAAIRSERGISHGVGVTA